MLTNFGFIFFLYIYFVWNDEREQGALRAWTFTWVDSVKCAFGPLGIGSRTLGRVCSAAGSGKSDSRVCGPWRVEPVMMGFVTLSDRSPG